MWLSFKTLISKKATIWWLEEFKVTTNVYKKKAMTSSFEQGLQIE